MIRRILIAFLSGLGVLALVGLPYVQSSSFLVPRIRAAVLKGCPHCKMDLKHAEISLLTGTGRAKSVRYESDPKSAVQVRIEVKDIQFQFNSSSLFGRGDTPTLTKLEIQAPQVTVTNLAETNPFFSVIEGLKLEGNLDRAHAKLNIQEGRLSVQTNPWASHHEIPPRRFESGRSENHDFSKQDRGELLSTAF